MESKLLSVILHDRKAYSDIKDTLSKDDFSDLGGIVLKAIDTYYSRDEHATSVDKDILADKLVREYPQQAEVFKSIMEDMAPVSVPNVLSEYVEMRLHSLGQRIASKLTSGDHSPATQELITEYEFLADKGAEAIAKEDNNVYVGVDIDDLFEELDPDNLIHLYPPSLNDKTEGGAPRGSHIVVFARPEVGKSMIVINMCAGFLKQGLKVLYIGNEDPAASMRQRILSSLTGMPKRDILMYQRDAQEEAEKLGYSNLVFASLSPGSVADVKRLVYKYKPDVIIVDQIRNLQSSKSLTKVEHLEYTAQSMRNIGKEANAVVVSVTQAGDSASDKLILDLGDVDFSNTGIPSTADLMIGIGMNHEYETARKRMISLPKNKISGVHDAFPVSVVPELSQVEDV